MTLAQRSPDPWRRHFPSLIATLLVTTAWLGAATAAPAATGHRHALDAAVSSGSALIDRNRSHLTFYPSSHGTYPNGYYSYFCIKDVTGRGSDPLVKFKYHFVDGTTHVSRFWYNPNGAGTTLCHKAWLGAAGQDDYPRFRYITVILEADGRTAWCRYPNKYVLGSATAVECNPPKTSSGRIRRVPLPAPAPASPAPPAVQPAPAPPPVIVPGRPRGCTPTDRRIVAKLRLKRRKGRPTPRILSVRYTVRPVRRRGGKAAAAARHNPRGRRRARALRAAGRLKRARTKPFRVRLANGFAPSTRVRIVARVRYRWSGDRTVYRQTTRRVIRICA